VGGEEERREGHITYKRGSQISRFISAFLSSLACLYAGYVDFFRVRGICSGLRAEEVKHKRMDLEYG
jgi:hypothetical protein